MSNLETIKEHFPKWFKSYTSRQRAIDYGIVFSSEEGKRVLNDILRACNVLTHPLELSPVDLNPNNVIYREGERSVALRILKILNVDPERFILILKEDSDNA